MLIKISFKYSFFIKIAKFQLNNFNRLVININGEKILGLGWVGGCCNCYIILGGGFQKCYTVLYRVGVVKNFQFLRYIICARSLTACASYLNSQLYEAIRICRIVGMRTYLYNYEYASLGVSDCVGRYEALFSYLAYSHTVCRLSLYYTSYCGCRNYPLIDEIIAPPSL